MNIFVVELRKEFAKSQNPKKAIEMANYMKTKAKFWGIQKVEREKIEKNVFLKFPLEAFSDFEEAIFELWKCEAREEMYSVSLFIGKI